VQNVLCARGRPQSQEPMVGVRERPPAADGDEAGVAVFGEDHGCTRPVASAQRLALPAAGEKQARKRKPPKLRIKLQKRTPSQPSGACFVRWLLSIDVFYHFVKEHSKKIHSVFSIVCQPQSFNFTLSLVRREISELLEPHLARS